MTRSCLILAARGKKGHERQAAAVADRLGLRRVVVEVEDNDPAPALPDETALVLAAGRQAIGPARTLARRRERPPVAVLQPVWWRPRDFDLVWAPLHDRGLLPPRDGRLETLTAPSAVAADRAAGAALLAPLLPVAPVGVLIGGATAAHRFGPPEAAEFAARLAAFAVNNNVPLAISTSRRTGAEETAILAERLAGHLFVDGLASDASLRYAGIIDRARAFVVTADSAAMLSDAATTGRPIYGWRLPGGRAKFETLYRGLERHGAMRWFDGGLEAWDYPPLDAAETVAAALRPKLTL